MTICYSKEMRTFKNGILVCISDMGAAHSPPPPPPDPRLSMELVKLQELASANNAFIIDRTPLDNNEGQEAASTTNIFIVRLLPNLRVFDQGAFKIELKLPTEYPFRPPHVRFITPIYHPLVDGKGNQYL
jgi:ubiquitin-protein ligase